LFVRITVFSRALARVSILSAVPIAVLGLTGGISPAAADDATVDAAVEHSVCFDGALARTRTEVDTDIVVPQFDGSLGTLLDVSVTGPDVHLDTDAVFESTAGSAVVFAEKMDYQLSITSPGGLASPAPIVGTIQRVPSQTLAAFDGTLDFLGGSAVTQALTTRDESASGVTAADAPVLTAFTGAGTVPFHLSTSISETFMGGGGNVQAQINTFVSANVRVCYRYEVVTVTPPEPPTEPPVVPPVAPPTLPATGSTSAPLAALGVACIGLGGWLAWRWRPARPTLGA
jgi:LPXTG-motif cell wall-anchored protein